MIQKIVNVLAVTSAIVSATVVGGGVYVYLNRASIIEDVKSKVMDAALGGVTDSLPSLVDTAVPDTTGAPIALPSIPKP